MSDTTARLPRPGLTGARLLWVVLASTILLYVIAGLPHLLSYYGLPCEADSSSICGPVNGTGPGIFNLNWSFSAWYNVIWIAAICVSVFVLCSLLAWRKRDDPKMLLFSIALLMTVIINVDYTLPAVLVESWPVTRVVVVLLVYCGQIGGMMFYVFPDGRFVPGWTRWLAAVFAVLHLVVTLIRWWPLLFTGWAGELFSFAVWIMSPLAIVYAFLYRFRTTANAEQRQQIKWIVWALALAVSLAIVDIIINPTSHWLGWDTPVPTQYSTYHVLISPTFGYVETLLVSVAFYIAIFQYRLWDVDFLINRSLVYGGLTVLLGSVLVGVFVATQALLGSMVQDMQAGAAGIVAVIVVIALFSPIRDRLQRFVDSRVYGVDSNHERAVQAAIAGERDRLSQELHDSVTQSLYGLAIMAESCQRLACDNGAQNLKEPLTEIDGVARQALKELRLLIYELRPPVLEEEGLLSALYQRLAAVERRSGIEANLAIDEVVDLPARTEEALYHIAIEALNNAIKHAEATSVSLSLGTGDTWVELEIADDGKGFEPGSESSKGGMGLLSMHKRAEQLGGMLTIHSMPGQGTKLTARIPYQPEPRRRKTKRLS